VDNNTIFGSNTTSIFIDRIDQCNITNNFIYNTTGVGIQASCSSVLISGNLLSGGELSYPIQALELEGNYPVSVIISYNKVCSTIWKQNK
jgi:hypothetical protein